MDNIRTVRSFVTEEAEIQNYSDKINVSYFVAKKRCIHVHDIFDLI